jgi:REP element-mobilizing transposase RayT
LTIIAITIYFIFTWVNRYFILKREHNDLLRQIVQKMDKGGMS